MATVEALKECKTLFYAFFESLFDKAWEVRGSKLDADNQEFDKGGRPTQLPLKDLVS